MKSFNVDWIQQLYYEQVLRNNTEKSHDEHERYDQSIEKDREGNRRVSNDVQTRKSTSKNDKNK